MLVLVTNRKMAGNQFLKKIEEGIAGGVTNVILREKDLNLPDLVLLGRSVKKITASWGARLYINSGLETAFSAALEIGAEGMHLPFSEYVRFLQAPEHGWKRCLEEGLGVGVSIHSLPEAEFIKKEATLRVLQGKSIPDYLLAGHIFETSCKEGLAGRGLGFLEEICQCVRPIPVVAIGGIKPENIQRIKTAGASGAAVMGAFMNGEDTGKLAKILRTELMEG